MWDTEGNGSAALEEGVQYFRREPPQHQRSDLHPPALREVSSLSEICPNNHGRHIFPEKHLFKPFVLSVICAGSFYLMSIIYLDTEMTFPSCHLDNANASTMMMRTIVQALSAKATPTFTSTPRYTNSR